MPSSWGLNLYGPNMFSVNPFFKSSGEVNTSDFSGIAPSSSIGKVIQEFSKELWSIYLGNQESFDSKRLLQLLVKIRNKFDNEEQFIIFIRSVYPTFSSKIESSRDLMAQSGLYSAISISLLPYVNSTSGAQLLEEILSEKISIDVSSIAGTY